MPNHREDRPTIFFVPCSCGRCFAAAQGYDHQGGGWGRFLECPHCGRRHDPRNRLLRLGYQPAGYWKADLE